MRIFLKKQKSKFEEKLKEYKIRFVYDGKNNFSEVQTEIDDFNKFLEDMLSKKYITFKSINKDTTINLNNVYFIEYTEIKKGDD